MKRLTCAAIGGIPIAAVLGWTAVKGNTPVPDASAVARAAFASGVDSLGRALTTLDSALAHPRGDATPCAHGAFRAARAQYKHIEGALEFYAPALAAAFNSRRQEVDDDDAPPPATLGASGFPVVETLLWPALDARMADSARRVVQGMQPLVARARTLIPALRVTDAQVIELTRLELARVSSLGIAGFDTPLSHDAALEAASALDGVRNLTSNYGRAGWARAVSERHAFETTLMRASAFLRRDTSFDSFNRLAFIAFYSVPASNALDSLRRALHTIPIRIPRAWRADAPSIYTPNAFDVDAYAPTTAPPRTSALAALGARLFGDPRLSGTGMRSCASCHQPRHAFSDGVARAVSIAPSGGRVARHTPTLINAALQPAEFADERAATLEDQVLEVLRSPSEMGSSAERAAVTLGRDAAYRKAFADAFGNDTAGVTALRVRQSIAAYLRTLTSVDSRFDHAVRGDTLALSADERHGFTLFMGKGGCGTCHFAPLFGGVTPPLYLSSDVEVIGTTVSSRARAALDPDSGRARIDHLPIHVRAFKTPSLRNVALTAPYMHNGAFATLDDVVAFYDRGGGRGGGAPIANQTLSADSLHLTADERRAIVAFLGSLTSSPALR